MHLARACVRASDFCVPNCAAGFPTRSIRDERLQHGNMPTSTEEQLSGNSGILGPSCVRPSPPSSNDTGLSSAQAALREAKDRAHQACSCAVWGAAGFCWVLRKPAHSFGSSGHFGPPSGEVLLDSPHLGFPFPPRLSQHPAASLYLSAQFPPKEHFLLIRPGTLAAVCRRLSGLDLVA